MGKKMLQLAKGLNSQFKTAQGDHKMVLVGVDEMVRVTNRLIELEKKEAKRKAKKAAKKNPEGLSIGDTVEVLVSVPGFGYVSAGTLGVVKDFNNPKTHTYPYLVHHESLNVERRYARAELRKVA